MLDPKGNTAVYLMYSYVRISSVLKKSGIADVIYILNSYIVQRINIKY